MTDDSLPFQLQLATDSLTLFILFFSFGFSFLVLVIRFFG